MSTTNTPPSTKRYGIQETKELLDLAAGVVDLGFDIKKGGTFNNLAVLPDVISVLGKVQPAFDGIELVDDELKDLEADEIGELIVYLSQKLGQATELDLTRYIRLGKHLLGAWSAILEIRG